MKIFKLKIVYIFTIALILTSGFLALNLKKVLASTTDGTVDTTYKYAWGENIGWINFGADNGNVHITDSALSGYALSETVGWINLDNIVNDGAGNLSGYAWSENTGYINFNPTNSRVIINSLGEFTGSALSENIGWIIFDCDTSACVKTDWRPQSARVCVSWTYSNWSSCSNSQQTRTIVSSSPSGCSGGSPVLNQSCSSGGGGISLGFFNPPSAPAEGFKVAINNNADTTNSSIVNLSFSVGSNITKMSISNTSNFVGSSQEKYQSTKEWNLCRGSVCSEGKHNVYVKFYTQYGQSSEVVSDTIILDTVAPEIKIIKIKDYYSTAEDVVLTAETEAGAEIILRWHKKHGLIHSDKQGKLTINLDKMPAGNYQLELTPSDLVGNKGETLTVNLTIELAEEFSEAEPEAIPEVEQETPPFIERLPEILEPLVPEFLKPKEREEEKPEEMIVIPEETPISMRGEWNLFPQKQINEFVLAPLPKGLERLAQKFPELQKTFEKVGIDKITDLEKLQNIKLTLPGLAKSLEITEEELNLVQNLPTSELSQEIKNKIPTEIIFAKTEGQKSVDFGIEIDINDQGEVQQKITAISGKKIILTIRVESKAKSVFGYLAFKGDKNYELGIMDQESEFTIQSLISSFFSASTVFAQDYDNIEEKFITQKFAYADEDGDGIWTAEIYAPIVEGEYEILTLIEYEDPDLGTGMVKLTTVIDPEGYIYERIKDQELRIKDAVISIYQLNFQNGEYKLWQADNYNQKNPQTTNATGRYSFLVPEGTYYLAVEVPDYLAYQGELFEVKEGLGIHQNIEMKTKNAWLKMLDWKVIAIFLLFILVVWNFYRDRKRN